MCSIGIQVDSEKLRNNSAADKENASAKVGDSDEAALNAAAIQVEPEQWGNDRQIASDVAAPNADAEINDEPSAQYIQLKKLWDDGPEIWFAQAEANFIVHGIKEEYIKFLLRSSLLG